MKIIFKQIKEVVKILVAIVAIVGIVWIFLPSVLLVYLVVMGFILMLLAAEKDHEEQQREVEANEAEVLAFEKKVGAK